MAGLYTPGGKLFALRDSTLAFDELRREIVRHLAEHNADPRPYRWVAKGEDTLAKIKRARARLAETAEVKWTPL